MAAGKDTQPHLQSWPVFFRAKGLDPHGFSMPVGLISTNLPAQADFHWWSLGCLPQQLGLLQSIL